MIVFEKDYNGYKTKTEVRQDINEYVVAEAFYRFMVGCGYSPEYSAEAMFTVGNSFMNDEKMEDAMAEAFAKKESSDEY